MQGVNLIPRTRQETRRRRTRLRAWSGASAAFLLVLAGAYAALASEANKSASLVARLAEVEARLSTVSQEIRAVESRVNAAARELSAAQEMRLHADWSVLMALLARQRGEEVVLERVKVHPVDAPRAAGQPAQRAALVYRADMDGVARSQLQVSRFVLRLEESGAFEAVKLIDSRPRTLGGVDGVAFRLESVLRERRPEPAAEAAKGG